jgi:hypothetical protein
MILAVETVVGEPVSASYFPVSREITGKFWRSGSVTGNVGLVRRWIQGVPANSLRIEQGIVLIRTGNYTYSIKERPADRTVLTQACFSEN